MSRRLRKTKDGCCFNDNEALLNLAIIELRTDATREAFVVANDAAITFPKEEESRNEEEEDMREGERVTKVSLHVDVVYKLQKRSLASSDSHAEQFILKFSLFHSLYFQTICVYVYTYISRGELVRVIRNRLAVVPGEFVVHLLEASQRLDAKEDASEDTEG